MNDLISRQTVKEQMIKYGFSAPDMTVTEFTEDLLPSAQLEIIRCYQCKYAEIADKEDEQDGYTCQFHRGSIWFSGSYCSWAERRTDE